MLSLKNINDRFKAIVNIFLLILQITTVAAYFGMVDAKSEYQQISDNIYPDSNQLMNSVIAESLVSYPAFILIVAIFVFSVFKEVKVKPKSRKIVFNIIILLIITSILGIASFQLYAPILDG